MEGIFLIVGGELTGSATETIVASRAVARLTIAMEIKAAKSRLLGLNFSRSSGTITVSIFSSGAISVSILYMEIVDQCACRNSKCSKEKRSGLLTRAQIESKALRFCYGGTVDR